MFEGIKTLLNGAKASIDNLRQQIKTIRDKLTKTTEIASNALSTANRASSTASNALSTANSASSTASNALNTANSASSTASNALSTANSKANTNNPVFTGSFSQNRLSGTVIGNCSHAEGQYTVASGSTSHAEGYYTEASSTSSHAEGYETIAASQRQHVQGRYNIKDADGKYAHIVGNGTNASARSNAHTLDWNGNAWFSGKVRIGGSSWEEGTELIRGTIYELTALTEAAMPPMAVAENPMTVIKYNGRYYRLAKASKDAMGKDIICYTYTTADYNEIWKLYALSLDYSKTTAKQVRASVHTVMTMLADCLIFTGENGNDFTLSANKEWDGTMWSSTDAKTWTEWDGTAVSSANGVLYLRGKNTTTYYSSEGMQCQLSARAGCSGNIMTLLDYESPEAATLAKNCFRALFQGCTNLTTAPELPATTLVSNCYNGMFQGCTNLTTAPELPATTLAEYCYYGMFQGCTNLTTAPELPATTLARACYYGMFQYCTNLTTAPELPATTLAEYCYNSMFLYCTNLTTAPELPATTLAGDCYNGMFYGCTSLTTAPELPATTLVSNCYNRMFCVCTNLTTAPELPATTLAWFCYYGMFQYCTNLTTAPELPATTLAEYCYNSMFQGCTSLKLSTTQDTEYRTPYRIPTTGDGVSASYALTDMFAGTGGTFTGTPNINTTYYGAWD